MRDFIIDENSSNIEEIKEALGGIRKTVLPYIHNELHKIGRFNDKIKVYSIKKEPFVEALYALDKDNNKFFFPLNTLYGETKMMTDFSSSKYSCVIAKQLKDNHYKLYKALGKNAGEFGDIYLNDKNILCVFKDYRKTDILYRSREDLGIEYRITVELDESLDKDELELFTKHNEDNEPRTLLEFLDNFRLYKDIDSCSSIYISSNNKDGVIGEINIKYGLLDKYNISETEGNYNLDMEMTGNDINVSTTKDEDHTKVVLDELPSNLKSTYNKGIKLIEEYKKR